MIQTFITMTSKGTFTLPVAVRQRLGITKAGDKLMLTFHEQSKTVELHTIPDLLAMQKRNAAYITQRGIEPITDAQLRTLRQGAWGQKWERLATQND